MNRNLMRVLCLMLVVGGLLLRADAPVVAAGAPSLVTTIVGSGGAPRTDGEWVVWSQQRTNDYYGPHDIYAANLADRTPFPVAAGPGGERLYDFGIDDGVVVWTEWSESDTGCGQPQCSDVLAVDLATGEAWPVAATNAWEEFSDISGSWVVYSSWDGVNTTIWARDIATMAEPLDIAVVAGEMSTPARIDGDRIAWVDSLPSGALYTRALSEAEPRFIAASQTPFVFDVVGDTVIYSEYPGTDVIVHDVESDRETNLGNRYRVVASDDTYVYMLHEQVDHERGDLEWAEVSAYDPRTGVSTLLMRTATSIYTLSFSDAGGGLVTWATPTGSGRVEIHAASRDEYLSLSQRPDPDKPSPDWTYFPQTDHFLRLGFRQFWEQGGGLPVFGYPLTEEFKEQSPDDGQFYTAQYFERQRFEWHPENLGTPYAVLLGRLGDEAAIREQLYPTPPFQPAQPSPECTFSTETMHNLCGPFREYWESHGLEFGDADVSYRESLALFGFPISEAFVDPASGLTVQYFERAVFEYHPENAEPYTVLLRRLGADVLEERGW